MYIKQSCRQLINTACPVTKYLVGYVKLYVQLKVILFNAHHTMIWLVCYGSQCSDAVLITTELLLYGMADMHTCIPHDSPHDAGCICLVATQLASQLGRQIASQDQSSQLGLKDIKCHKPVSKLGACQYTHAPDFQRLALSQSVSVHLPSGLL